MDIFAAFSTDENLEREGKWFPLSKTARVLVARSGNEAYMDALRARLEEAQIEGMPRKEADKVAEAVVIDVMAETLLVGWEGLTDAAGNAVPYSVEQAKKYLGVKDFRKKIDGFANSFEAFRLKAEVAQGNA